MKTIAEWYEDFVKSTQSPTSGAVQKRETQRTFYAGFFASLQAQMSLAEELPDTSAGERQAMEHMQNWHLECLEFAKKVDRGEA